MKKYIYLAILLLIAALNFNLILKPLKLVTGGTQGLALLIYSLFKLRPSVSILIINTITLILSYFFLSKTTTYGTIASSIIYPICVKLTDFIPNYQFIQNNQILFTIIAGIVCGITGGYIYKIGFSSGGVSTVNLLLNKYLKIKVATANFLVNTCIIIAGCFIFGIVKGIYSISVIVISSILIDFIFKKCNTKI